LRLTTFIEEFYDDDDDDDDDFVAKQLLLYMNILIASAFLRAVGP